MAACIAELHRLGMKVPVLIGGAAINRNFGRRTALVDGEVFYEPGVYYCKDAFEGLDTMNALVEPGARTEIATRVKREAFEFKSRSAELEARSAAASANQQDFKVSVSRDVPVPAPPFWGARVTPTSAISFDGMYAGMDLKTLYRLHWGARGDAATVDRLVREQFEPRRLRLQRAARGKGWLRPLAVYGYFPCQSDGQDLIVFDHSAFAAGSPTPPRQNQGGGRVPVPPPPDPAG